MLDAATAAIDGASGVHVTGTGISGGRPVAVDLSIQDGSSSGTITIDGTPLEITTVGTDTYVKGDQQALEGLGIPPAAAQLGADRWLKLKRRGGGGARGLLPGLLRCSTDHERQPARSGG